MDVPCVHWLAPATVDEVGPLRRAAAAAAADCGLAGLSLERFELAVSEALTNVVVHAYPGASEPGPVRVEVERDEHGVRVTVADEGVGMATLAAQRGLGMGLGILATAADCCEIRTRRGSGTRVVLGFALDGAADGGPAASRAGSTR
jgi:anti-sigma regulatory factor (Ser/Thr protein kinase)